MSDEHDTQPDPAAVRGEQGDPRDRNQEPGLASGLVSAAPTLARLTALAWWRAAGWTATSSLRAGGQVLGAARSGQLPTDLVAQAGSEARAYAVRLLGLAEAIEVAMSQQARESDDRGPVSGNDATAVQEDTAAAAGTNGHAPSSRALRERGEELLRRSADIDYEEDAHPAYERILDDMAPDEARILRLLCREGAQAAVDVRTSKTLGVTSEIVAPGLSMIGEESGCRYLDRVPAYLNNLHRLGLVWFSRESLGDPLQYQVLEAQPKVTDAMAKSGRTKTVRRSIHLTPFGDDFCDVCLPMDTGEIEALDADAPDPDEGPNVSRHPV
jgi:Abortive infection alpha